MILHGRSRKKERRKQRDMNSKINWVGDKFNPGDGAKKPLDQIMLQIHWILDSLVGIETRRRVGRPRVRIPAWTRGLFLRQKYSHQLWDPEKLQSNRYRVTFPEIRQSGRDVRHLTPSSAGVENEWSYTSTPPVRSQGADKSNVTLRIPNTKTRKYEIFKSPEVQG
jgi:hypothetical protein